MNRLIEYDWAISIALLALSGAVAFFDAALGLAALACLGIWIFFTLSQGGKK